MHTSRRSFLRHTAAGAAVPVLGPRFLDTESLGTVIHGLDLAPGDEAVMTNQDYGSMLEQFRQQSRRRGIACVEIAIPLHPRDDQEMVDTCARAITPRTKVLLLSHMVNITGQILPVRKIADMART